jgi:XTP/dITP diphosphohydrolase
MTGNSFVGKTKIITMKKIVLATSNRGKLAEMKPLLAGIGVELVTQGSLGVQDAIEDGHTFVENALIKARHAATVTGLPAIADDSGLIVDALDGAPGLISAHYAGVHGDAEGNIARVLAELRDVPDARRSARFISVIVLLRHPLDPQPIIVEGLWEGRVLHAPRGDGGFGYNPIFLDPASGLSAAEMSDEARNLVSHRGQSLTALRARLASALAVGAA